MSYVVVLPYGTYSRLQLYRDYLHSPEIMVFAEWLVKYPEILTSRYAEEGLVLEFESEQYYHWFLLQQ